MVAKNLLLFKKTFFEGEIGEIQDMARQPDVEKNAIPPIHDIDANTSYFPYFSFKKIWRQKRRNRRNREIQDMARQPDVEEMPSSQSMTSMPKPPICPISPFRFKICLKEKKEK